MYPPNQMNPQQQQGGFGFDVNSYEAAVPFETLPPAWYNVLISSSEMKQIASGKGTACANEYTVFGGPFDGRKLFDNLNIIHENEQAQDIARRSLRAIQDAIGKQVNGPWDLQNMYMCVKVSISKPKKDATPEEKANFDPRNEVKGYKPFDQQLHTLNQQQPAVGYNVQVQPQAPMMGNGPGMMPQQAPQFAQQSPMQQQPQMQPQGQPPQFQQQAPQPQQQFQPQQAPQPQFQPQQPQAQQQYAPQPGNAPGSQPAPMNGQPDQANYAPAVTAPAGQPSPDQAAHNAAPQSAQPSTFAPQNQQPQQPGNVPPPQNQAPQPQQQIAPNPQFAPQQQGNGTPPPPMAQPGNGTPPPPPSYG